MYLKTLKLCLECSEMLNYVCSSALCLYISDSKYEF